VNLLIETAEKNPDDNLVSSKDSKAIISGDIQPVQLPGKSWKPMTYEDHTFDQSRRNAVYPMTHLYMDLDTEKTTSSSTYVNTTNGTTMNQYFVRRTGKPASLIYLGISEPETTFRLMNEIFYMMQHPSFDSVFRNPSSGALKSNISFIVDNGHAEDPDSPLTQMCLVRIFKLLNLNSISQRSFAEYHSKRNFVERVHASENEALSRHGAFSTHQIHESAVPGSQEHIEIMEKMAKDVVTCISGAKFGGHFINCIRGVTKNAMIFDDEKRLKAFLLLSEERKWDCDWKYEVIHNPYYESLVVCWGIGCSFQGSYKDDYATIMSKNTQKDKYGTAIFGNNNDNDRIQPLPDYVALLSSKGEQHYLSHAKSTEVIKELQAYKKMLNFSYPAEF
jgi:hypothetical protein